MRQADNPPEVFRLARKPDPWAWPEWAYSAADGTFGNRYDDPRGTYRVLYASTQRFTTFVECLAFFRPDIEVLAELAAIAGDDRDGAEPTPAGLVPREWLSNRCVGRARLLGDYVDVGHHETIAELRSALARRVVHYGLHDFDAATIRLVAPRGFTQELSRLVFEHSADGERRWNGLTYKSRHGDDLENWAIFEPASPQAVDVTELSESDPDLLSALRLHDLQLG